jgi:hypothetical protein
MGSSRGPRHQVTIKGTLHELRFSVLFEKIWILEVNVRILKVYLRIKNNVQLVV